MQNMEVKHAGIAHNCPLPGDWRSGGVYVRRHAPGVAHTRSLPGGLEGVCARRHALDETGQ